MPWTEDTRKMYKSVEGRSQSELTDAEWKVIKPLLPNQGAWGDPCIVGLRMVFDVIMYL